MKSYIKQGDCLELMKEIPDKSIDMILCDPPYNISRINNFTTMGRTGIDFGEWDKGFNLTSWIKVAKPLLKKGGNIVIFNDWKNMSYITEELENNGFDIKDLLRWKKTNAMPRNRDRRFISDYEVAVWAVKKGGKWTFNRLSKTYEIPEILCCITPKSEKVNGGHTTQKPIYVMEWIIERLSDEGDTILDPFLGSGTTCIASLNKNRKYIGFEKDKEYYDIAKERIMERENVEIKR